MVGLRKGVQRSSEIMGRAECESVLPGENVGDRFEGYVPPVPARQEKAASIHLIWKWSLR